MDAVSFHDIEKCFLTNAPSFSKELVLRICSGGDGVCSGSCEFGVGGKAQWWYDGGGGDRIGDESAGGVDGASWNCIDEDMRF